MSLTKKTPVACPNCRTQFVANIEQVFDAAQDSAAKRRLLSGQANVVECPNCQFQLAMAATIAYHDPTKELLLIHVPMELNISQTEQEQQIGELVRYITDSLPQNQRKGYLLKPRRTFTMQGMIDSILEADGITKEMLNERRKTLEVMERFLAASSEQIPALVAQYDEQLNEEFFRTLALTAEAAAAEGSVEAAQHLIQLQSEILPHSTYGKALMEVAQQQEVIVQKVTKDLNKLKEPVTHEKLIDLALTHVEDDDYLQAFVALIRPALDYAFFQALTARMEDEKSKKFQRKLNALRDRLLELTQEIDQEQQVVMREAATVLQEIVNSPDIETAIRERLPLMNNMFMAILEANLQEAQKRQQAELFQRLQQIYLILNNIMLESSPPEIRFINELLRTEDMLEARLLLIDKSAEYGEGLLDYMDALIHQLSERGEANLVQRIKELREEAKKVLEPEK